MTRRYLSYILLTCFLVTQAFRIGISSTSQFNNDSKEPLGSRGTLLKRQRKENCLPLDSYLGEATRRLRHSTANETLGEKETVRRLFCIHSQVYRFQEYVVLDDQRIYVNSTGAIYEQYELMNTTNNGPNATVCLMMVPLQCNGSYINLNSSQYCFLPNLTLVYKSFKYDFGNYAYENETVYICVGFNRTYQVSTFEKPKSRFILTIVTYVGFTLSVLCLVALIVTYSIFKQLRSLPGKNLMSLALSLALAKILFICGSVFVKNQALCTGMSIANHYFIIVYCTASSVIAFHSCSVFGRSISLRRSQKENDKRFLVYFLVTWAVPALFVPIFSLLDHYFSFAADYGGDFCSFGPVQTILLLFVLPNGAMLLFKLSLFVFMAARLCKNRNSNSQVLATDVRRKRNKENVLICIKLSTLMGFSWSFLFMHVVVESKTAVFFYLFVIFFSFQGVFICVSFLFNRRCFELYRGLMSKKSPSSATSASRLPKNTGKRNCNAQETKL